MTRRINWTARSESEHQLSADGRRMPAKPYIKWKDHRAEVETMIDAKASLADIAARFGCNTQAVTAAISRMGLSIDKAAWAARCAARLAAVRHDPEVNAKRVASQKLTLALPHNRLRLARTARMQWRDPEARSRLSEGLRRYQATLPPEVRRENGRRGGSAPCAWCPAERLDEYRALRLKLKSAKEAKRIIIEDILAKERANRPRPRRRSFEEQLAAAAAGAQLIVIRPLKAVDDGRPA